MSIMINDFLAKRFGLKGSDKCQCGNYRSVVHCPACGSTQCYGVSKLNGKIELSPASSVKVRGFRCRLCQEEFTEFDCFACHAITRFSQKQDKETRASEALKKLPTIPPPLQDWVREQQIKRGIRPFDSVSEQDTPRSIADEIDGPPKGDS